MKPIAEPDSTPFSAGEHFGRRIPGAPQFPTDEEFDRAYEQLNDAVKRKRQEENRRLIHEEYEAERAKRIVALLAELKELQSYHLEHPCLFCRDFGRIGGLPLHHDCEEQYGFKINSEIVTCPECGREVEEWHP